VSCGVGGKFPFSQEILNVLKKGFCRPFRSLSQITYFLQPTPMAVEQQYSSVLIKWRREIHPDLLLCLQQYLNIIHYRGICSLKREGIFLYLLLAL